MLEYWKKIEVPFEALHNGPLLLVNSDYPLHVNRKEVELVLYEGILLEKECKKQLEALLEENHLSEQIQLDNAYRTEEEQRAIFSSSLRTYGEDYTRKFVALPNNSEHQTGYAFDLALIGSESNGIAFNFPNEGAGKIFREVMAPYGFIERYQQEKEAVTRIGAEPWHFRYVGYPHSLIMQEKGYCLEEYETFLERFTYHNPYHFGDKARIYYVKQRDLKTKVLVPMDQPYTVSGNNKEGFVITVWIKENETT